MTDSRNQSNRILLCAYACNPEKGSEESVGWDTALALAGKGHDVVVLTRSAEARDCMGQIPAGLSVHFKTFNLNPLLAFVFSNLGKLGVELGYLLWSLLSRRSVLALHREMSFHTAQHVTYARYWMPLSACRAPCSLHLGTIGRWRVYSDVTAEQPFETWDAV